MATNEYDRDYPEFGARVVRIVERLAKLTASELKRYQQFTLKQEERIAKRLGIAHLDHNGLGWRFVSLEPDQLNAFWYTHIRSNAHMLANFAHFRLMPPMNIIQCGDTRRY